jgi:hypothetical protein
MAQHQIRNSTGDNGKVYNVKVGGTSIGITDNLSEANAWLKDSMSSMKKEICPVRFSIDPKYLERA